MWIYDRAICHPGEMKILRVYFSPRASEVTNKKTRRARRAKFFTSRFSQNGLSC